MTTGFLFEIFDEVKAAKVIDRVKSQSIKLRPYQAEAVDAAYQQWIDTRSTLINLATGLGKSVCFAEVMRRWDVAEQGKILLIAHRTELIFQAVGHAKRAGLTCGIEMAGRWAKGKENVIVASVQSLNASQKCGLCFGEGCDMCSNGKVKRFTRFNPRDFGLVVVDECFPAGTLIDGVAIQDITPNDVVTAFDETTLRMVKRKVVRVFKRLAPSKLVRITTKFGTVVATGNHPFLTKQGWKHAIKISIDDEVFGVWESIRSNSPSTKTKAKKRNWNLLQSRLLFCQHERIHNGRLREMQQEFRSNNKSPTNQSTTRKERLLLGRLHACRNVRTVQGNDGKYQQKIRIGKNAKLQSNAIRGNTKEGFSHNETSWTKTSFAGRQWSRNDKARANIGGRYEPETVYSEHENGSREWIPNTLQTGLSRSSNEGRNRNRRGKPQEFDCSSSGQKKRELLDSTRVEGVEVFERGCDDEFNKLCPDGHVYNFEVDGEHTYIANGFAVHNCHHAVSTTYRNVLTWFGQNPNQKTLLVTATPKRQDKIGMHNVCDSVAYEMDLKTGIDEGWLVPIRQKFVTVEGLDISKVKTSKGDLQSGQLEQAFLGLDEDEERMLHSIVKPTLMEANGRKTIVFASGKEHANKLAACFNANGVEAGVVTDDTDLAIRAELVERYSNGDLQVLVNCMCFTEGFDAPQTAVIANCRPTKSESLYLQIIGRGTRPLAGIVDGPETAELRKQAIAASEKNHCVVLDFCGNSGEHKLVSVADVLAGDSVDPIDLAQAIAIAKEEGETVDTAELIEKVKQARKEAEDRKEAERIKRLMTSTKADHADYTAVDVNLFAGDKFDSTGNQAEMASYGQRRFLKHLGIDKKQSKHLTKKQASGIISNAYKAVQKDWKTAMDGAKTQSELHQIGRTIAQRKASDYMLRDEKTIAILQTYYKQRREALNERN